MARETYEAQVALLVRVLPHVAGETVFALKGGTAINLFYRDLPRLSVDIDLTYLPIKDRTESLDEINAAMDRIAVAIETGIRGAKSQRVQGGGGGATRLLARLGHAEIKIETSPVTRGVVHDPEIRTVSAAVEDAYGYAEMQIVSFEDLFAGKLHAALDRQHPRDLYDVTLLYENEGLTQDLLQTFLIYVASSPRPAHELLDPNLIDLGQPYAREFEGMTRTPVPLDTLLATRLRLIADVQSGAARLKQSDVSGSSCNTSKREPDLGDGPYTPTRSQASVTCRRHCMETSSATFANKPESAKQPSTAKQLAASEIRRERILW